MPAHGALTPRGRPSSSPAAVLLLAALSAGLQTPRRPLANPSVSHVALHERPAASLSDAHNHGAQALDDDADLVRRCRWERQRAHRQQPPWVRRMGAPPREAANPRQATSAVSSLRPLFSIYIRVLLSATRSVQLVLSAFSETNMLSAATRRATGSRAPRTTRPAVAVQRACA